MDQDLREIRQKRIRGMINGLMAEKKINKACCAGEIGVAEYYVYSICDGHVKEPTIELLTKMSKYFGVSVDWLVGMADDPAPAELTGKYLDMAKVYCKYLLALQARDARKAVKHDDPV